MHTAEPPHRTAQLLAGSLLVLLAIACAFAASTPKVKFKDGEATIKPLTISNGDTLDYLFYGCNGGHPVLRVITPLKQATLGEKLHIEIDPACVEVGTIN